MPRTGHDLVRLHINPLQAIALFTSEADLEAESIAAGSAVAVGALLMERSVQHAGTCDWPAELTKDATLY